MTVIINGDTGISGVNGSAANPAIKGSDADTGIHFGSDSATITTGGTERVSVDSTGAATFSGTVKTSKVENANTSNGGVEIDTAGHVQLDGLQLPTAGPLSNRNLIINGAMQVAQRGTSSTSGSYGSVDRMKIAHSESNTQSQISLSSTDTPYSLGFRNALRLQNSTVSDASASTYREIDYVMEAQDIANSGWDYTSTSSFITLSFWLKASVTQSYYLYIRTEDGTKRLFIKELAVTANTWTKFEIAIPGYSGITLDNNNGFGLRLRFIPWYGTTYTEGSGTLDAWSSQTSTRVPDMTSTWVTTLNSTFDLTGLQLEVGSKATPFEHESYGQTLAKCQRYYFELVQIGGSDSGFIGPAHWWESSQLYVAIPFPVEMRTVPTASALAAGTGGGYVIFYSGGSTGYLNAVTGRSGVQRMSKTFALTYFMNWTSLSNGTGSAVTGTPGNSAWLERRSGSLRINFSAEL
jgi:hypothetical protein